MKSSNQTIFFAVVLSLFASFILTVQMAGCDGFSRSGSKAGLNLAEMASPASANSQSPRLSQDVSGNPLLSWIETKGQFSVLKYSTLAQGQWSPSREVARGNDWVVNGADTPSIMQFSENLMAAHWLVANPAAPFAYDIFVSHSLDNGKSWSKPLTPHTDGTATEHGFVNLYKSMGDDLYGVVWLDGRSAAKSAPAGRGHSMPGVALRSAVIGLDGSVHEQKVVDHLVCDCCPTALTQGLQGPIVAYRNRDKTEQRDIYYTQLINGQWSEPSSVGFDDWHISGCPVNGPAISSVENTVAIAWFTAAGGRKSIRLAVSLDGGQTFGAATEIDHGDVIGRVSLAIDGSRQITVSWLTVSATAEATEIQVAVYALNDQILTQVTEESIVLQTKKPNGIPIIASLAKGAGVLAWTGGSVRSPKVNVYSWGGGLINE